MLYVHWCKSHTYSELACGCIEIGSRGMPSVCAYVIHALFVLVLIAWDI